MDGRWGLAEEWAPGTGSAERPTSFRHRRRLRLVYLDLRGPPELAKLPQPHHVDAAARARASFSTPYAAPA